MLHHGTKEKLQHIIGGASLEDPEDSCATIRNLLCRSFGASRTDKSKFNDRRLLKEKQEEFLERYAAENSIFFDSLPSDAEYLTKGGEAQVYFVPGRMKVLKVNDAVYYATWLEFFDSLVMHNILFPTTI